MKPRTALECRQLQLSASREHVVLQQPGLALAQPVTVGKTTTKQSMLLNMISNLEMKYLNILLGGSSKILFDELLGFGNLSASNW